MELDDAFVAGHEPVVRSRLAADLRALGVGAGEAPVVMVHTRLSALGWVVGGAQAVVAALLDALGPAGTLLAYTSWREAPPYGFEAWPPAWRDAFLAEQPPFDPATAPAAAEVGRLPETVRTWPGALRSRHPDVSFAAVGPRAAWLVADHPLDEPHGPGSPMAKLVEAGGQVLLLGAPLGTMTLLHHAEALARVPAKRRVTYSMPMLGPDGRTLWRRFKDIDTDRGAFDYEAVLGPGVDQFEVIVAELLAAGTGVSGPVGEAMAHLVDAGAAVEFGVAWMEARWSH
jgi:aminoglycoside 3-N-acetyltransferase